MSKTVLVTGAVINTGVNIAEKFAQGGYDVIVTSRGAEKAKVSAESLQKNTLTLRFTGMDLIH